VHRGLSIFVFVGSFIICIGLGCLFTAAVIATSEKRKYDQKTESLELKADVSSAIQNVDEAPTLAQLIKLNRAEMAEYHEIVKAQAHRAFQHCQMSMAAGFVILLTGAVTVALPGVP
jgi:hypothetical protein